MYSIISDLQNVVVYEEAVRKYLEELTKIIQKDFILEREGNVYKLNFKYNSVEIERKIEFGDIYKYCLEKTPNGNLIEKYVDKYIVKQATEQLAVYN